MIVAIDGPAGSGKSTVAREVARRLGFTYLDSGAMYRAVTLGALDDGADLADGPALGALARRLDIQLRRRDDDNAQVSVDGVDVSDAIREPRVTGASSAVAAHPEVRAALLEKQRALIAAGDYVVEGRDIGTVVAPDAPVKAFLTADPDERDTLDSTRSAAPLRCADDAELIDTTGLDAGQVVERILALVERARAANR
jgi:cytidylate kinase